MIQQQYIAAALIGAAVFCGPLVAQELRLGSPVACDLTSDCYILQYVDHDAGPGARDFRCAPLSYDGHRGTDFAARTLRQMHAGVNVIASAPGIVRGVRDGMPDQYYADANAETVAGRECGNGVIILHERGWETQYCHLKRGSVTVSRGDRVKRGDVLGEIGLSGRTQAPHVDLIVRRSGAVVDPFDPDGVITCGAPSTDTLWQDPPAYRPGGLLDVGFASAIPDYDDIKAGTANAEALPADAAALVVYGFAFGGQRGDRVTLRLTGPGGEVVSNTVTLDRNEAQFFRAAGKRRTTDGWPRGRYTGSVTLIRNGRAVSERSSTFTVY
ncbi:MAG: M23 family metallopeptidase [Pseudomonadota bacterium]